MKIKALRNSKGDVVATFPAKGKGLRIEAEGGKGEKLEEIEARASYASDPDGFHKKHRKK